MCRVERYTIVIPNMAKIFMPSEVALNVFNEKTIRRNTLPKKATQIHTESDQVCIGAQCSCKKMHFGPHDGKEKESHSGHRSDRNYGRKPLYKEHHQHRPVIEHTM